MAISKRIHLMAIGLAEEGQEVDVLVINPTELPTSNTLHPIEGKDEIGVSFLYTGLHRRYSKSWLCRRVQNIKGLFGALAWLWSNRKSVDAVLLYTSQESSIFSFSIISKLISANLIFCRSEHPFYAIKSYFRKLLMNGIGLKLFDGYVLISSGIVDYFLKLGIPEWRILKMPIITDDPRQSEKLDGIDIVLEGDKGTTIFYCGDWSEKKDGLLTFIRAFSKISSDFPDVFVELAGKPDDESNEITVKRLITSLNMDGQVRVSGYLEESKFQFQMKRSIMFVLPKPDNFQAKFSMPSKLAEYLMTGSPVIVSDIGDVSDYLLHGISAYFVPPGDVTAVSEAIRYILNHPAEAKAVGLRGQVVANESFHYRQNANRLSNFLNGLPPKRRT
jgi:glycosyltransferase involved in cell wall biosynthesis